MLKQSKRYAIIFVLLLVGAVWATTGCQLVTNTRAGMQMKVGSYFDEDGHTYPKLDDRIFRMKMRLSGVLTPQKFVKEIGVWIFLLAPHDPEKIPVLFLHGHWSGPPVFQEIVESIDTDKYEPWMVFYPSGLDIRETTRLLQLNLARLSDYYNKDEVYIIAYSFGGLVGREAIVKAKPEHELPNIPLFIGIANPWGGSIPTESGAKFALTASPDSNLSYGAESWKQAVHTSPFIDRLYQRRLPPSTEFHMIYSLGGNDEELPGRDDGMLREASLGRKEAVAEAASVTVFEKPTHASIISHYLTIRRIIEILADFEARKAARRAEEKSSQ